MVSRKQFIKEAIQNASLSWIDELKANPKQLRHATHCETHVLAALSLLDGSRLNETQLQAIRVLILNTASAAYALGFSQMPTKSNGIE